MPIQIDCPSCHGAVRVPEDLLGQRVQCPRCQATFIPEVEDEPLAERPAVAHGKAEVGVSQARPSRPRDGDEFDDGRPLPRAARPHRGAVVLTLGILSLILVACGPPLGVIAWVMGSHDLNEMRRGGMDRAGEGITQAGRILGMISCVVFSLGCLLYMMGAAMWGVFRMF